MGTACCELSVEERWVSEINARPWRNVEEYVLFLKQRKAYEFAAEFCAGGRVLDFGCGSGYGAASLSAVAARVVGVDVDESVIGYCARRYATPNLTFLPVSPAFALPFPDRSFGTVVSFQVIEHVPDAVPYLRELRRVLADGGVLLLTTPNRRHRLFPRQKPWNPEHYREYSPASLRAELRPFFADADVRGIDGNAGVRAVEIRRVRKQRFASAVTGPLRRGLKAAMPAGLVAKIKALRLAPSPPENGDTSADAFGAGAPGFLNEYSLGDFAVIRTAEKALDLLAICCTK